MTMMVTLTIQLSQEDADLLENVARFRADEMNPEAPVDISSYIRQLFNEDVARCLGEITQKRSV